MFFLQCFSIFSNVFQVPRYFNVTIRYPLYELFRTPGFQRWKANFAQFHARCIESYELTRTASENCEIFARARRGFFAILIMRFSMFFAIFARFPGQRHSGHAPSHLKPAGYCFSYSKLKSQSKSMGCFSKLTRALSRKLNTFSFFATSAKICKPTKTREENRP